ncbi:MAG TPA: hypothetical protein VHE09_04565 [Rhizomicrobium sp.]|nr:hypothetical protein [Rhizomicrobium sp.]
MADKSKRDADGIPHSKPGSVDEQSEDSFPASDAPSFSPGAIGAPEERTSKQPRADSHLVKEAAKKVKSGGVKKPESY